LSRSPIGRISSSGAPSSKVFLLTQSRIPDVFTSNQFKGRRCLPAAAAFFIEVQLPDPIFIEIVEKMLSDPDLKSKITDEKIEKVRKLLTAAKLPSKADLSAALEG
jgi:hypothetical protein